MNEHNYQEVVQHCASWVEPLIAALSQANIRFSRHDHDPTQTFPSTVAAFQIGGAFLLLTVEKKQDAFRSVLVVTELIPRRHRPGIGNHHIYVQTGTGCPNFSKAIQNVVDRAKEIEDLSVVKRETTVVQASLHARQTEEMIGVLTPPGMLLTRDVDGSYVMHVGMIRTSLNQVRQVCRTLTSPAG